jgi:beta-xylosidase
VKLSGFQTYGISCYDIYRTAAGGTPSTTGLIASCVGSTYFDQGAAGDSSTAPTTDTTVLMAGPWNSTNQTMAAGMGVGADLPPASPTAYDDEFQESTLSNQWTIVTNGSPGTPYTAVPTNGAVLMQGVGTTQAFVLESTPSSPYSFTAKCTFNMLPSDFQNAGIMLRESGTQKFAYHGYNANAGQATPLAWNFKVSNGDSTGLTANVLQEKPGMGLGPVWLRVQRTGSVVNFSRSFDGLNFTQVSSTAATTFFTTDADQVGFYVSNNSSTAFAVSCDYIRRTQ